MKSYGQIKSIFILLLFFGIFPLLKSSWAADHAVRPDCPANGDGSSWNCGSGSGFAYNTLPPENTLTRGDTYYFSKGTIILSYYRLQDAENGTLKITFKKATDSSHGPSGGWTTSLGNAQTVFSSDPNDTWYNAIFNGYSSTGYYVFDGSYGTGQDPSAYGFKFIPGAAPGPHGVSLMYGGAPSHGEYYHLAFIGPYPNTDTCSMGIEGGGDNTFIQDCLFDGFDNAVHGFAADLTVDRTWFTNIWGGGASSCHGQQLSYNGDRLTVSNSVFIGIVGKTDGLTSTISFNDARSGLIMADSWKIYNNLFIDQGNGIISNSNSGDGTITNMTFVNNTVIRGNGNVRVCQKSAQGIPENNVLKNNLWYNSGMYIFPWTNQSGQKCNYGFAHDYNYWDSTTEYPPTAAPGWGGNDPELHGRTETVTLNDLFINPALYDYRIKKTDSTALNNGIALNSPYNVDKNGVMRPQGAGWDMGAYEYVPGGDTTPPAAPTGLSVR